jgi:7 transmembrane receptor (Secretin family)
VPCLLVSLCIFTSVRELRNMYGKLITIIVVGFIVTDVALLCRIYTTHIQPEVCNALGYVSYFAIMFDYFWGTVLCFDIWLIFSGRRNMTDSDRFSYYTLYACGLPVLLTGAVGLLDVLKIPNYDPKVRIFGCFLFGKRNFC